MTLQEVQQSQVTPGFSPAQAKQAPKTEYIFIVGVSRSGTTLMKNILNMNAQIAIARENHFLGHLIGSEGMRHKFKRFGDLSQDQNVRSLVNFIYSGGLEKTSRLRKASSHWRWIIRRVDPEVFTQKILASDRSERAMFEIMMQLFADRKGKPIMGEKTPAHLRHVPTLLGWFPNARVIHMLRDPRAIFVSELRRRKKEAQSFPFKQLKRIPLLLKLYLLLQTTVTWRESARKYKQYRHRYPDHYYPLRFEDLVREPEKQIRALCEFLGVPFQAEMLDQTVVSSGFQERQAGFDDQAAGRWIKQIDPWINSWFKFWFRGDLRHLGFTPE